MRGTRPCGWWVRCMGTGSDWWVALISYTDVESSMDVSIYAVRVKETPTCVAVQLRGSRWSVAACSLTSRSFYTGGSCERGPAASWKFRRSQLHEACIFSFNGRNFQTRRHLGATQHKARPISQNGIWGNSPSSRSHIDNTGGRRKT